MIKFWILPEVSFTLWRRGACNLGNLQRLDPKPWEEVVLAQSLTESRVVLLQSIKRLQLLGSGLQLCHQPRRSSCSAADSGRYWGGVRGTVNTQSSSKWQEDMICNISQAHCLLRLWNGLLNQSFIISGALAVHLNERTMQGHRDLVLSERPAFFPSSDFTRKTVDRARPQQSDVNFFNVWWPLKLALFWSPLLLYGLISPPVLTSCVKIAGNISCPPTQTFLAKISHEFTTVLFHLFS